LKKAKEIENSSDSDKEDLSHEFIHEHKNKDFKEILFGNKDHIKTGLSDDED